MKIFSREFFRLVLTTSVIFINILCIQGQTVTIDGSAGGKRFDGIGAVSGGGATSVLLKDYPEPQRSQVLDLLFKPKFGASISAFFVEIPGDGNSTQGSEPSHMHTRTDENYSRGYEWWLMSEAKKRNPSITLDCNAWSCPYWVGGGNFWSQDMCDYDVKWIKGLKNYYGLDLNAIGCRNEKGVNESYVKMLRKTLNSNGLSKVKIHAFDNWGDTKFDWCTDMNTDTALRSAVDIMGAHTMSEVHVPANIIKLSNDLNKPIWNTEEHVYRDGFDCEISLVKSFNENYIIDGVTKIINWYLVAAIYGIESYPEQPALLVAREPWSGYYYTRPVLWGYAHYGQFSQVGWQYVNGACGMLTGGGTYVTLKSPGNDYSIIIETKNATANQDVSFKIAGGLSEDKLCVWKSNSSQQFVLSDSIALVNDSFKITLQPKTIYTLSTTRGQQKGSFSNVPVSSDFPFPYYETFEEYSDGRSFGYYPQYTADIAGIFEIAERPDNKGKCLRQVTPRPAQSWAPEWAPYTIIGNSNWKDYEVSSDIYLENGGFAGIMGRVNFVGSGYGTNPAGYYMIMSLNGTCSLYVLTNGAKSSTLLASGQVQNISSTKQWHNLKLRFSGTNITGFVDSVQVLNATNSQLSQGMAALLSGDFTSKSSKRYTVLFDNLLINSVNGVLPAHHTISDSIKPIYNPDNSGIIHGQYSVCKGDADMVYRVSPISGATAYTWVLPSGVSGTSTSDSISVNFSDIAVSGRIMVKGNGIDSTIRELYVLVNSIPNTPILTLTKGTLTSNILYGNQWYYGDSLIHNAVTNSYTPSKEGNYHVIVAGTVCPSSAPSNIISYTPLTSLKQVSENNDVQIYPNPTSGLINVQINVKSETGYSIEMYDEKGTLLQVIKKTRKENIFAINFEKFSKGIYTLSIISGNKTFDRKIVKN